MTLSKPKAFLFTEFNAVTPSPCLSYQGSGILQIFAYI